MKIKITIEAITDKNEVVKSESGEICASKSAGAIRQWCMETYTSVKMAAIFNQTQT